MYLFLENWSKICSPLLCPAQTTCLNRKCDVTWCIVVSDVEFVYRVNLVVVNNRICRGFSVLKWRPIQSCWFEANEDQREYKIKDAAFYIFWPQSTEMNDVPSSSSCSCLRLFKWRRGGRLTVPSGALRSRWRNKFRQT